MTDLRISHTNKRKLHDFHGGIHPEENKWQSTQERIQTPPLPPTLIVPLLQHSGKPAKAIVQAGDKVLKGQLIAEADGLISANVHAPSSGVVREISDQPVAHPSGLSAPCVVIDTDGKDEWLSLTAHEDYLAMSREESLDMVRAAGIAGMGGAGFPSNVKLHPANVKHLNMLVINGVECEPYITADDMLMRERADEILRGIGVMARILEPKEVVLAIEDNKPEACLALQHALADYAKRSSSKQYPIELAVLPTKYPSGGEKQLIQVLTGQEVPSGGIPADIGIVCQNVATARAVYRAVCYGEPLISRITTLTGEQFGQACNVEALIGTPVSWLLKHYGYTPAGSERLIMGGPMMGFTLHDTDTPIVKTSNCILAPSTSELPNDDLAQACIRCGLCTEACPADLLPQQLYWFSRSHEFEKAEHHNLFDCIECGACAYVCPSSIPLVQYYRHAKGEIKAQRLDHEKSDRARIRFEARQERLEREAQEKEAKRKARAEAAAKLQAQKAAETSASAPSQAPESDPKKAAIEAALARKAASKPVEQPQVSIEELQNLYDKAQSKLDVLIENLEQAKSEQSDNVAKLQRAVEKNQLRVNQAKQNLEKAKAQAASGESSKTEATIESTTGAEHTTPEAPKAAPDLDALQKNVTNTEAKLEKLKQSFAEMDGTDETAREKMARAIEKNEKRLAAAKQALSDAQAETN